MFFVHYDRGMKPLVYPNAMIPNESFEFLIHQVRLCWTGSNSCTRHALPVKHLSSLVEQGMPHGSFSYRKESVLCDIAKEGIICYNKIYCMSKQ